MGTPAKPAEQLLEAVKSGNADAVRGLLEREPALARIKQPDGASAILLALYHGHQEMLPLFLEAGAELDFWEACAAGKGDRVAALLDQRPGLLNELSPDGYSPLALAAFFGHAGVANLLMARGADVNAVSTNAQKVAPLHAAVARRDAAVARALLDRGADPNREQAAKFTPLDSAAFHGDREIAEMLVARGADVAHSTGEGKTAADLAAERGHEELAEWLRAQSKR